MHLFFQLYENMTVKDIDVLKFASTVKIIKTLKGIDLKEFLFKEHANNLTSKSVTLNHDHGLAKNSLLPNSI